MRDKKMMQWNGDVIKLKAHNTVGKASMHIAMLIQRDAVLMCPVDQGQTRQSISISDEHGMISGKDFPAAPPGATIVGTVRANAPFTEFGTGPHKKANGSAEFVASMKDWCAKHGLKEFTWAIIKSIRRHGTKPHPFMRPALQRATQQVNVTLLENGKREFGDFLK
jgi:hypothetical protein